MPKSPTISSDVREDPVAFTRTFLTDPFGQLADPHPAQVEMLHNIAALTVACCGRQLGKSVMLGWYITWFSCTHPNREIYIIAPTVDQSRIVFNEVARHFRKAPLKSLLSQKIKEYPFPEIRLANGTRIHGRGANNPQFIRGKPLHLAILDEAAFFKDGVIAQVIEPMLTVTGKLPGSGLVMISTPFGQGEFYDYALKAKRLQEQGKGARFHHYTSLDNPHANMEFLEEVKNTYGEESMLWRSEYLAEFVDGDLAVFPWSSIKWAIDNHPYDNKTVAPVQGHRYVQGVDLANVRDFFVSTILDTTNPALVSLVRYDRTQKQGYAVYKSIIRSNHKSYNSAKTLIDATSLGESVAEDLKDIGAEGYKFSNQSKYEVVQELARMLSEHRLTLPNDRVLIDELRYFQYEITSNKTLRMEAVKGHDDIVMSLALAAHLACLPSFIGFFRGVGFTPPPPEKKPVTPQKYYDPFKEAFAEI